MTPPDEARVIAGRLTIAQRALLTQDKHRFVRGYKPGEKLVELGLLHRQRGAFGDRIAITDLGQQIRAILLETPDAE